MTALTVEQTMERFCMSRESVLENFRRRDSPAYKVTPNKTAPWRVDEDDFKLWLQESSKEYKG